MTIQETKKTIFSITKEENEKIIDVANLLENIAESIENTLSNRYDDTISKEGLQEVVEFLTFFNCYDCDRDYFFEVNEVKEEV